MRSQLQSTQSHHMHQIIEKKETRSQGPLTLCLTRCQTMTKQEAQGLDVLLGHLLDKRILVWCKLTTVVAVQISLKIQVKSRYMYNVFKNRKCTEWPQTKIKHLTVKTTLHTLHTYPWDPNFGLFCSTTSRFRDTRSSKIENAPNDPKLNLKT